VGEGVAESPESVLLLGLSGAGEVSPQVGTTRGVFRRSGASRRKGVAMPYLNSAPSLPFSEPTTSRDAAIRAQSFSGQQAITIVAWFAMRGEQGGTQRECSEQCGYPRASVSARVNELHRAGLLVKTSVRRQGCAAYVCGQV
jgi:hypothetical protein